MKKLILFMLGSAMLATSAFAKEAKKQLAQTALSKRYIQKVNAVLDVQDDPYDGNLWGTNVLPSTDAYVQAYNTSTSQTYYMTIYANNASTAHITLPTGTYNISVSTGSTWCDMYVADDDDWDVSYDTYYHTFYGVTINSSYATVVSVE